MVNTNQLLIIKDDYEYAVVWGSICYIYYKLFKHWLPGLDRHFLVSVDFYMRGRSFSVISFMIERSFDCDKVS